MKVAVLGYGVVGVGVYEMLKSVEGLVPGPVLVRPGKNDELFKVTSIEKIVNDPSVDAVAEVMGGIEPAFSYVSAALKAGKHAVTSNKALVTARGTELVKLAEENDVAFLFSAACGGGVPFLHNIALAAESDEIISVGGILNGTTNYMLDSMQRRDLSYGEALTDAQKLGYAEADPTADVTGLDALRKIILADAVAFNVLPNKGFNNEGIDSFTAHDVEYLKSRGLVCRLIAYGKKNDNGSVCAYVEPVVFGKSAPELSVLLNNNMARYIGKNSGPIVLMGQGAGRWPTASAVLRDLCDINHDRMTMMRADCVSAAADNSGCRNKYLIRYSEGVESPVPIESKEKFSGNIYAKTKEITVSEMHAAAEKFRKNGAKMFFASIGE